MLFEQAKQPQLQENVAREQQLLASFHHPFIVSYVTSLKDAANLYIVMERVEGGDLFTLVQSLAPFPLAFAKFYAACLVVTINELHSRSIVYRDLKPEVRTMNSAVVWVDERSDT